MNEQRILKVLLSPHISEKSTIANENNQYVFKVIKDSTKPEIKQAIEKLFNVKVVSVQVVNLKPKKVQFKRMEGTRKAWKKAYVRLADGSQIDFTGGQA
ncbi:MAG: 50S ribosomal protein L23 [Gammaproteobacteria bacterium]|nr:50S ribosomal protein L23 [Gammaproteobacteria bacterium]